MHPSQPVHHKPTQCILALPRLAHHPQFPPATFTHVGARSGAVVKALRYKPAGRGFDSQWCYWHFTGTLIPSLVVCLKFKYILRDLVFENYELSERMHT